ncbi:MAG: hypothetical protein Q7U04_08160 [Bacteriovorax sp.]|nr:hypothetical protein [Bacteriovorax sp.]
MNFFIIGFYLIFQLAWAGSKPFDLINNELDQRVSWLISAHPKKKSILEKFGKPQLIEKNTLYYALDGYKYSLCIKLLNDKVSYISYKIPPSIKVSIKDFEGLIKSEDFSPYPNIGHEKERYYSTFLKEEKIQLIFNNNSAKNLEKIIYDEK